MKIIADSGSTKCTWLLTDGVHTREVRTRGINAVQHSAEQIREALAELPPCDGVTSVRFYGAGCGETFPEASEKLRRELEAERRRAAKSDELAELYRAGHAAALDELRASRPQRGHGHGLGG